MRHIVDQLFDADSINENVMNRGKGSNSISLLKNENAAESLIVDNINYDNQQYNDPLFLEHW